MEAVCEPEGLLLFILRNPTDDDDRTHVWIRPRTDGWMIELPTRTNGGIGFARPTAGLFRHARPA
jgi:hypothetical protein